MNPPWDDWKTACAKQQSRGRPPWEVDEEQVRHAMADPEIQQILHDARPLPRKVDLATAPSWPGGWQVLVQFRTTTVNNLLMAIETSSRSWRYQSSLIKTLLFGYFNFLGIIIHVHMYIHILLGILTSIMLQSVTKCNRWPTSQKKQTTVDVARKLHQNGCYYTTIDYHYISIINQIIILTSMVMLVKIKQSCRFEHPKHDWKPPTSIVGPATRWWFIVTNTCHTDAVHQLWYHEPAASRFYPCTPA